MRQRSGAVQWDSDLSEQVALLQMLAPDSIKEVVMGDEPQKLFPAAGYERLANVLIRAHDQAAYGKGKERHANGKPFHLQPIQDLIRLHGVGFATGQASKKASEALGLPTPERQIAEILGAMVYLAGAIIAIEDGEVQK